jgi:carboxypeptidase C (cathepsin A)
LYYGYGVRTNGNHVGPIFNEYIETQNAANISDAKNINLAGVLIGNGWYDPLIQYQAYYNYTVFPGNTYDFTPFNESMQDYLYNNMYGPGNCYDMIVDCNTRGIDEICNYADVFCANQVENIFDVVTGRDEYDVRELVPDAFPEEFYVDYLNTPEVQVSSSQAYEIGESQHANLLRNRKPLVPMSTFPRAIPLLAPLLELLAMTIEFSLLSRIC